MSTTDSAALASALEEAESALNRKIGLGSVRQIEHDDLAVLIQAARKSQDRLALLNQIADLGTCAHGKTPAYKLFQQALDLAVKA